MTAQEKKDMIEAYAKTYIYEDDRQNCFGAVLAKFDCCVTYYLCEKKQFERVVARLRNNS
jgi:hypothetical protein